MRLVCALPNTVLALQADPAQVKTALMCLVRNAIEAAPPEGWAAVRVEVVDEHTLELVVEDNGNGPTAEDLEHLFDPFYSGRKAGRGRGLGLPTAWRLARQHGGEVRFANSEAGPTRFLLRWPRGVDQRHGHSFRGGCAGRGTHRRTAAQRRQWLPSPRLKIALKISARIIVSHQVRSAANNKSLP